MAGQRSSARIAGVAVVVSLALAVLAATVLFHAQRIGTEARSIAADAVPGLVQAEFIRDAYSEEYVATVQALGEPAGAARDAVIQRINALERRVNDAIQRYRETIHVDPVPDNALLERLLQARREYSSERDRVFVVYRAPGTPLADTELLQRHAELLGQCDALVAYNSAVATRYAELIRQRSGVIRGIVIAVVLLVVATTGLLFVVLRQRRRVEADARETQEKLATAFRISPTPMAISRLRDAHLLAVNDAFVRTYGTADRSPVGKAAFDVGVWDTRQQREEAMAKMKREGRLVNYFRQRRLPDGSVRSMLLSAEPIVLNGEDCVVAAGLDVTELIETQQALARSAAELTTIFDFGAIGIALVDADGRPFRTNPAFQRMVGYTGEELAKFTIRDITFPDDLPRDLEHLAKLREGAVNVYHVEKRYVRKSGEIVWANLTSSAVRTPEGKLLHLVAMVEDITERKRADVALRESERARAELQQQLAVVQKLEALGQLAGGVAHDFNNILAAITLHLEALKREGAVQPDRHEAIDELLRTVRRGSNLTRQLLLFSRRQPAQRHAVDFNALVAQLLKMLARLVGANYTLAHRDAQSPGWVLGDAGMLEQVVMNLVLNARDAMPGGGTIELVADEITFDRNVADRRPGAKPGRYARLRVADNGHGMSPETLNRIFEPFFTTKAAGHGTGLGLSTALGIVQQHGGWIEVNSEVNRGTSFVVHLPLLSGPVEAAEAVAAAGEPAATGGQESILVVDDNEHLRTIIARVLRGAGYRVHEAANGEAALALLARETVDLLLADVIMPGGMMGDELARRLPFSRTRVILTSAYPAQFDSHRWTAEGGEYLGKPFTTEQLLRTVRKALEPSPGADL